MYLYSTFDVRVLGTWVEEAVRRNVEELSLNFKFYGGGCVDLFDCLFACKTLVSLELAIHIFVDVPAKIHLPCLRVLKLKKVKYANDDTLRRLISSCPVLEDLTLERTAGDNIVALDINAASVKRITVSGCACDGEIDPRCKLLIKAPLLEWIDLNVKGYFDFLIEDASNLAEAKIEVGKWFYEHQFFKLLREIANVRFLCLVPSSIWSVCPPEAKFPMFHNLVRLDIQCCCVYRHGLMSLLEYSDNLEQLVYHNVELHQSRKCDQALVGSVPKCVSMRLKSINFRRLSFNDCAWTLPRYFLTNAKFLKQMKIGISSRLKKNRRLYLGNLLNYPRASVACEIGFFRESTMKEINLGSE
ncbi:F-box/LRR-repeat protein [Corchorus capsularis]|uniref:F-box/LRR-repeat protein n=1 Tax=Corchorus capsularis TaxID=210143 RepID=A0A1R3HVU2_COCAP|nr:F-box/LRR-repeat protein [Corchorus capsularis]